MGKILCMRVKWQWVKQMIACSGELARAGV